MCFDSFASDSYNKQYVSQLITIRDMRLKYIRLLILGVVLQYGQSYGMESKLLHKIEQHNELLGLLKSKMYTVW